MATNLSVFTRRHGRKMVMAGGSDFDPSLESAPFEATGLACRACYDILLPDMAEVTWELVRRRRIRRIHNAYPARWKR